MKGLSHPKTEKILLSFHLILGALCLVSKYFFLVWIFGVILYAVPHLYNHRTRHDAILYLTGYFFGIELIGRMVKASPIIPYSVGSYFLLVILPFGILTSRTRPKTTVGLFILLLCFPAFFMIQGNTYITFFVNSFSGILCVGLAAIYFSMHVYGHEKLLNFLKCIILPITTIALYVTIKAPDLSDIEFGLSANSETTGGFGSNQVSTILGVGICLLTSRLILKEPLFSSLKYISIFLVIFFLFRGLLTFSRGGIVVAVVSSVLAYLYFAVQIKKNLSTSLLKMLFFIGCFFVLFEVTDSITGGILADRYKGETLGTKEGYRDRDLTTFTSNRSNLADAELKIFADHPYFGVGPGGGYAERKKYIGLNIASHTEVTRLMSEQGIPGLIIAVIFIAFPFYRVHKAKTRTEVFYLIIFFSIAILTSFHSGMRTIITPLLWGFSCANFHLPDNVSWSKPFKPKAGYNTNQVPSVTPLEI